MASQDDAVVRTTEGTVLKVRRGSRVILLNERDEICLFLAVEGNRRLWITP